MNKRAIFLIIALIVLLIAVALLFRSCQPRVKDEESATSNTGDIEINGSTIAALPDTRNNFINASAELTCEIIKNPELEDQQEEMEKTVREIYQKHELPVSDNGRMLAILTQYENDNEVIETVRENSSPCLEGGQAIIIE